jgi:opacity protein-like surface antigen
MSINYRISAVVILVIASILGNAIETMAGEERLPVLVGKSDLSLSQTPSGEPNSGGGAQTDEKLPESAISNPSNKDKFYISGGYQNGFTAGLGYKFSPNLGVELGGVFKQDELPTIEDGPLAPGFPSTPIGERRTGGRYGLDAVGFLPVTSGTAVYVGGGAYYQEKANLVRANDTGLVYKQSTASDISLAWSTGIQARLSKDINVGVGYHSLRGINVQFFF